jgi:hypothetical protein
VDFTHLITQYIKQKKKKKVGAERGLEKKGLYFELMLCDKYRGKNTGPQCVNRRTRNTTWRSAG